jgi:hypothetical protein
MASFVGSQTYTDGFNEVKNLGAATGSTRTTEQTNIAYFWVDGPGTASPPGHWNRIAQTVSASMNLSVEDNARLFALLNLAEADTGIATWDAKAPMTSGGRCTPSTPPAPMAMPTPSRTPHGRR